MEDTMHNSRKLSFEGQDFFIGIDTHKKDWKVEIRHGGMRIKGFSMNPSPEELYKHMTSNYPNANYHSVYEAGFCGFWIHRQLSKLGFNNIIVHSPDVPTSDKEKQSKSDKVDAGKLSRELENGSLKGIYILDEKQEHLRSLCRLYHRCTASSTRVKNRIKSHLYLHGVKLPDNIEMTHWSNNFITWLGALTFSHQPGKDYLDFCLEELLEHRQRQLTILRKLRHYCREYQINGLIKNLRTLPGIGFKTAISLYTEIVDINRFPTFDHLKAFVGIIPSLRGSGDHTIDYGIVKRRNKYLRYLLIEASWVAIRRDPALLEAFDRLTRRMKKQNAIIRIAKKLLNRIRYVWKNSTPYVMRVIE